LHFGIVLSILSPVRVPQGHDATQHSRQMAAQLALGFGVYFAGVRFVGKRTEKIGPGGA
jgi:hypothetical protein